MSVSGVAVSVAAGGAGACLQAMSWVRSLVGGCSRCTNTLLILPMVGACLVMTCSLLIMLLTNRPIAVGCFVSKIITCLHHFAFVLRNMHMFTLSLYVYPYLYIVFCTFVVLLWALYLNVMYTCTVINIDTNKT